MSSILPREKLAKSGLSSLTDVELLALFLGTGTEKIPVIELADRLLRVFGGLRGLLQAGRRDLEHQQGLGPAKSAKLLAVLELARRHLRESLIRSGPMESPEVTEQYLKSVLRDHPNEVFACLFLDTRHRVIAFEELFYGTIDGATVYPRVVAEKALRHGAAALIVAHNHPSGISEPSLADQAITRRLKDALALLDIRLLDHFVVGDGTPVSMAARGML
ncbi:MAG: DNA repair protein RadC [Xanthomonadales bacterium]|jgi:DNA repair protein RadC|nr:DNA repair protein RadC [Xanthomonadales bacterium]MDH3923793.1 DNA repair protein RadC [Xanthomonadales bacterium]MDH3942096.1 DNA repair protein RadC [Xanthomonadales bacterium]MDH3999760.1 DNA repair protein RadC [Xanthomonadales bacterium]